MNLIGVDIGSSFIKAAVLDLEGRQIVRSARAPFPEAIPGLPAGHFEIDPALIVEATGNTIRELLEAVPDCSGILFCSQMGGLVLADRLGNPRSNYLSWRDQRSTIDASNQGEACFHKVRRQLGSERFSELGQELKPGSMLTLLAWLGDQGALPEGAVPLGLGEFVVSRLCGSPPATEPTSALGTLDLRSLGWHTVAFKALGLDRLNWPNLSRFHRSAGAFAHAGRSIECYPAIGDHQAALAGSLLQAGELSINVSTGSQVSQITPGLVLGDYQTRPYFDGTFLNTVTHLPAGRSLQVLIDLLSELAGAGGCDLRDPWQLAIAAAEKASDGDPSVDLAFFAGPMGNRGAISNITTENLTVGGILRGAFRNMAENYDACACFICPQRNWSNLVFSGGLVQKTALLREIIAKRLGGQSRTAPFTEDTLAGLLALGLVVSGQAANVAEATRLLAPV
ncbi:MAG: hypothetical protein EXS05_04625 [Planctomycetaceae bacterium]|nr:hypothetical protein [Planctomycetaceae bacterium]